MSFDKKLTLSFLVLFFVFFLLPRSCFSADDILNISISDFESTLEVLQGECEAAPFIITNRYNETVHIYYRIDAPSDMDITSYPKDYTQLSSGASIAGNLKVCIGEYFENETYDIKFWLETLTKVNESRVKSKKYTLELAVLDNPDLETTTVGETTTIGETTTVTTQTINTIPVYTPTTTRTVRDFDVTTIDMVTDKPDLGVSFRKDKLVTVIVIVIAVILIIIPYFTFMKSRKRKTKK